jgi:hypothetical protein
MQRNFVGSRPLPDMPARRRRTATSREHPVIETIEWIAERAAGGMIAVAPLFWLALLIAFVAVSLGIIPTK